VKAYQLLGIFGFQGYGTLRAHQGFTGLMTREGMLGITFRAHKKVGCSLFKTSAAFASNFTMGGFFSHLASSFMLFILNNNHYPIFDKGHRLKILLILC
jgi:hypothetical protein